MSGHSKWAQIKRQKGVADIKKAAVFTKLANAITLAARQGGGDPEFNFKLRLVIDKAKEANMPKSNIEKAIQRGTGQLEGTHIEEVVYEGFAPGKVATIISAVTDNKNRTVSEVKHLFNAYGSALGAPNSVMWMFEKLGVLRFVAGKIAPDAKDSFELTAIDAGASDIKEEDGDTIIYSQPNDLHKLKDALEKAGHVSDYAEVEYVPKEKVEVDGAEQRKALEDFIADLEALEDVTDYYMNAA